MYHLHESEADYDEQGSQEDEYRGLGFAGDGLVERGGGVAVHIVVGLRVLQACLEGRVLVEILAAPVGCRSGAHQAYDAGGDGDHQHLGDGYHVAVGVRNRDEGDHCRGDRRAGDTHLGCYGSDSTGAFGAYPLLEGDVADDGHDGVDHVPGAHQHGEEEGHQRGQEGDVFGMLAEHPLRYLYHPVHASGGLQGAGAGDGSDDDVDDVRRRGAGLEAESEYEDGEADAGDRTECEAAVAGTHVKRCQNDEQLDDHGEGHSVGITIMTLKI